MGQKSISQSITKTIFSNGLGRNRTVKFFYKDHYWTLLHLFAGSVSPFDTYVYVLGRCLPFMVLEVKRRVVLSIIIYAYSLALSQTQDSESWHSTSDMLEMQLSPALVHLAPILTQVDL